MTQGSTLILGNTALRICTSEYLERMSVNEILGEVFPITIRVVAKKNVI
jgi:hypothetical protein